MDHYYLNLAYSLALQNAGNTAPNPSVGAVIVRDGHEIGSGSHCRAGEDHAEVVALRTAAGRSQGATLYASLEPCAHFGQTPPCTDAIIRAGIKRVAFAVRDTNPAVTGSSEEILKRSGIQVDLIEQPHISKLYEPWLIAVSRKKPFVIAKVGMTANGIISPADRNSQWITNETSLEWVHYLRAQCDAILIGADTALLDRPHLTVRVKGLDRRPLRIIVDSRFKLSPQDCSLLSSDVPILVCGFEKAPAGKERDWKQHGVDTLRFQDAEDLLSQLYQRGIRKVLVEGGQKIFTMFHTAGAIDEYILMIAPRLITGKHFLNVLGGPEQSLVETKRLRLLPPLELNGDVIVRLSKLAYV
jgi:diaminohydroxyphosphoribosylaminopyrimidine deaminase/5-amino-6-(5-phosphoribosylamino)uracil reductase